MTTANENAVPNPAVSPTMKDEQPTTGSGKKPLVRRHSVLGLVGGSTRVTNDAWKERQERLRKVEEMRKKREESELSQCTFSPVINSNAEKLAQGRHELTETPSKEVCPAATSPQETFHPEVNEKSRKIAQNSASAEGSVFDRLAEGAIKKNEALERARKEAENAERAKMRAKPEVSAVSASLVKDSDEDIVTRLMAKQHEHEEKIRQQQAAKLAEEEAKATFQPSVGSKSIELASKVDRSAPIEQRLRMSLTPNKTTTGEQHRSASKPWRPSSAKVSPSASDAEVSRLQALLAIRDEEIASLRKEKADLQEEVKGLKVQLQA